MRAATTARQTSVQRVIVCLVVIITALVTAMASIAGAQPVKSVPAAGVGTKAALNSPQCGDDGRLAYPYQQRAPCTRPLKKGESNGGATSQGVTAKTIKVVLLLGNHQQQDQARTMPGGSAPVDHATGQPAYPTPAGRFQIVVKWVNPWWYPPASPWAAGESPTPPGPGNPLVTRWMGLSAPGVGIHGTPQPQSIGYSLSHGCIRMLIPQAEWLFDHVTVGTTVFIV